MTPVRLLAAACTMTIAIAGCASKAPVRSAYTGADQVGAVSTNMLIGNWAVRVLNPVDGEDGGVTNVSYSADGNVIMNANPSGAGVDLALRMTGTWQMQGDTVTQTLESIEETSGSQLGAILTPLLGAMKDRATGSANIYEATPDRVVLVSTDDGQALEYTRLP